MPNIHELNNAQRGIEKMKPKNGSYTETLESMRKHGSVLGLSGREYTLGYFSRSPESAFRRDSTGAEHGVFIKDSHICVGTFQGDARIREEPVADDWKV